MPTTVHLPALGSRAAGTRSSAIRDLLDQAKRPGMVSLAGGLPDAALFPTGELATIAAAVVEGCGATALQYGPTPGDLAARAALASLFAGDGEPVAADDLVVTTGSQQGLDLVARVLVDPGDAVVVGDPDYLGALQVFRSYGADLHPVAIDRAGLRTEQLEQRLQWGLRPKLCYLVPHFHNPTGATISADRRAHLNELSCRYGFVVVEDDPYRELSYDAPPPTSAAGDPELTVRLRSTSKTLAPGLRVGALAGPRWLTEAVVTAKQSIDLHTSSLDQAIVAAALSSPWMPRHLRTLREAYQGKRDRLVGALRRGFEDRVEFDVPAGGMFLWARFAEVRDTAVWLERCLDHGVCFVPGAAFAVRRDMASHARIGFATGSVDDLTVAVDRMQAAQAARAG